MARPNPISPTIKPTTQIGKLPGSALMLLSFVVVAVSIVADDDGVARDVDDVVDFTIVERDVDDERCVDILNDVVACVVAFDMFRFKQQLQASTVREKTI